MKYQKSIKFIFIASGFEPATFGFTIESFTPRKPILVGKKHYEIIWLLVYFEYRLLVAVAYRVFPAKGSYFVTTLILKYVG